MADITTPTGEALVDETPAHTAPPPVSDAYRRYALWLLLLVYVVNFIDRQVINILAEPIKNELHLADWQLGLLSGFAFASSTHCWAFRWPGPPTAITAATS